MLDGPPAQSVDEWPAWGVKAAIRNDSGSTVLKLLKLVDFARTTTTKQNNSTESVARKDLCKDSQELLLVETSLHALKSQEAAFICSTQSKEQLVSTPRYFVFGTASSSLLRNAQFQILSVLLRMLRFCLVVISMECVFVTFKESLLP